MSSILFSLPEFYESYKKWVSANPLIASDFETSSKWISYFIAGRINNSSILSELVYCLSNLLVLFNDRIITKARKIDLPKSGDRLKVWLTIVEYSEVFLELSAKKLWGEYGKWILISVVQGFKCLVRLLLLYRHKEPIIQNPPVQALQRKKIATGEYVGMTDDVVLSCDPQLSSMSFTLKRSGRVVRKVCAAPPNAVRDWKPLNGSTASTSNCEISLDTDADTLTRSLRIAETLYIVKPLIHLGSLSVFGTKTWKPWMIAFLIDVTSMNLYHNHRRRNELSQRQRLEMSRRTVVFLLYLLRSPFYERHTRDRLQQILRGISQHIPLVGIICNPLAQYLPHWQDTYFYMWST